MIQNLMVTIVYNTTLDLYELTENKAKISTLESFGEYPGKYLLKTKKI